MDDVIVTDSTEPLNLLFVVFQKWLSRARPRPLDVVASSAEHVERTRWILL